MNMLTFSLSFDSVGKQIQKYVGQSGLQIPLEMFWYDIHIIPLSFQGLTTKCLQISVFENLFKLQKGSMS